MYLTEAFRALNALNEDTFSVSDDGIAKLTQFEDNDDLDDSITVIDPEAETEEDIKDSYVGKVILDCSVCHSKLYKSKEEVDINEEEQLANVGEECPYCYTSDGFKVIGEVAAFGGSTEEDTTATTDDLETPEEEEVVEEGLFDKKQKVMMLTAEKDAESTLDELPGKFKGELKTTVDGRKAFVADYREYDKAFKYLSKKYEDNGYSGEAADPEYFTESLVEAYEDTDGIMGGDKGQKYSDVDLKAYWEKEKNNDPVLKNYNGNFDAWHKDTTTQMKKVNEGLVDTKGGKVDIDLSGTAKEGYDALLKAPYKPVDDVEVKTSGDKVSLRAVYTLNGEKFETVKKALETSIKVPAGAKLTVFGTHANDDSVSARLDGLKLDSQVSESLKESVDAYYVYSDGERVDISIIEDEDGNFYWEDNVGRSEEHFHSREEALDDAETFIKSEIPDAAFNRVNESKSINEAPVATIERPMSAIGGTLGNVMTAHKAELADVYDRASALEFLANIEPEVRNKGYFDSIRNKVASLPDSRVLHFLYNIILKGDGMGARLGESITESVNNVNVETDDSIVNVSSDDAGKVTVTTEPKDFTETEVEDSEETIIPVSDETQAEIESDDSEETADEEIDVEVEDFDEESFDGLGESYLKNIYENVDSYRTTSVKEAENKIVVEGVIKFNTGKQKKTSFVFEAKDYMKSGKARFLGENMEIAKGGKSFVLDGVIKEGKFTSESFRYNYRVMNESGETARVRGTVTNKKRG